MSEHDIQITIDGELVRARVEARRTLVDFLRVDAGRTGVHVGCEHGVCGACTVIIDGKAVQSCDVPVSAAVGKQITTVESLGTDAALHPLQRAFIDEQAAQCGYCASGILMAAKALLDANPDPDDAAIRKALEGNLCRCGTHGRILRAIKRAAKTMKGT